MNIQPSTTSESLWQTVSANPNDIGHLTSWIRLQEQLSGDAGARFALEKAAALPTSWLAKIWLTRVWLATGRLEESLTVYREVLTLAPRKSLAVQEISGHLGEVGYFRQLIELLLPIYSPDDHGPWAGFNLFNACEDTHDLSSAQEVLNRMRRANWPKEPGSQHLKKIVRIRQEKLNLLREMQSQSNAALN